MTSSFLGNISRRATAALLQNVVRLCEAVHSSDKRKKPNQSKSDWFNFGFSFSVYEIDNFLINNTPRNSKTSVYLSIYLFNFLLKLVPSQIENRRT